jgi:hypothetical protein
MKKMKKKNSIAALLVIVAVVGTFSTPITTIIIQSAEAWSDPTPISGT